MFKVLQTQKGLCGVPTVAPGFCPPFLPGVRVFGSSGGEANGCGHQVAVECVYSLSDVGHS
jgi:hypothetical protein